MQTVTGITSDANQTIAIVLPDNTVLTVTMYFVLQQYGWFLTTLNYNNSEFVCNGLRIANSFNMLYQWRNIIPFGLACISTNDIEPTQINSFSSGASNLYVLSSDEVAQYTAFINGEL